MAVEVFLRAALAGFAMSAPPGPVGALCVGRTLKHGVGSGLRTGLGAAIGDAAYGIIACQALSVLIGHAEQWASRVAWVAAPILFVVGIAALCRTGRERRQVEDPSPGLGLAPTLTSGFLLTLCAPGTLPGFLAAFTALGLGESARNTQHGTLLVGAGVIAGAMSWWWIVCSLTRRFGGDDDRWVAVADRLTGGAYLVGAAATLVVALEGPGG